MRLIIQALKPYTTLNDLHTFTDTIVCDTTSKECMSLKCPVCKDNINTFAPDSDSSTQLKFRQWRAAEKIDISLGVLDVFEEMKNQLKAYLIHVYIKRKQAGYQQALISKVDGIKILLQVDFSENASLQQQDEIQSVHWTHGQATLFTAFAWIDDKTTESIVLIPDQLQHTKLGVYSYMSYIFFFFKSKYPNIDEIHVISDGASSQFKQRYLFSNLYGWENKFDILLRWLFFATSHGKGVVDGLGGTVKRSVWRYVRSGRGQATTPLSFCQVAIARNPSVHIHFISADSIESNKETLEKYWDTTFRIANTQQLHFVMARGEHFLSVSDTSDSLQRTYVRITPDDDLSDDESIDKFTHINDNNDQTGVAVGDWVVVQYDGEPFPGEITKCNGNVIQVNVMHRAGTQWKWPSSPDQIDYFKNDV